MYTELQLLKWTKSVNFEFLCFMFICMVLITSIITQKKYYRLYIMIIICYMTLTCNTGIGKNIHPDIENLATEVM